MSGHELWSVIRFRADGADFVAAGQAVADYWRGCRGCRQADLVRNVDDERLWAIASIWDNIGSYRRSFSGYDAKMLLTPLLSLAIDEPSAYLAPDVG